VRELEQVRKFLSAHADEPVLVILSSTLSEYVDAKWERDTLRELNNHYLKQIVILSEQINQLKRGRTQCVRS